MKWRETAGALVAGVLLWGAIVPGFTTSAAEDRTSKFRVYQNDQAMKEFSDERQAVAYAKGFTHAYVEQIVNRAWVWDNFPAYKVYQKDYSRPAWEFDTLSAAIAEAKKWGNASVRELSAGGWAWDNYPDHPGYRLYQGDKSLPDWHFPTVDAAKTEAKKWANAHIIDLSTNRWIWDNVPEATKTKLRQGPETYRVYQGDNTLDQWGFSYLQDAVNESLKWANSRIEKTDIGDVVFRNEHAYTVTSSGTKKATFVSIEPAIAYAKKSPGHAVVWEGRKIWSNEPYYQVLQSGRFIQGFATPEKAAAFATKYKNSEVVTAEGNRIWENMHHLLLLGWNGTSDANTIRNHVASTQGLDIDSPTWFTLGDANGTLWDQSSSETVSWLHGQGVEVHPLVHNQFDSKLTTQFLSDTAAQERFIRSLVESLVDIRADGVNIDFESMSGADRDRYTAFVKALSEAARAEGLTVSIDLPRGSVRWNHLTAFDHEKLAPLVDYIAIMTYDHHYRGSPTPGPVAGLSWTEEGVQEFLSYGIPRSKLLLGVPFYVRIWELDAYGLMVNNRAAWIKDIPTILDGAEVNRTLDAEHGLEKIEYRKDGKRYVFWLENQETVLKRMELAKRYDLAGLAAWRLGYEPEELWTELLRRK